MCSSLKSSSQSTIHFLSIFSFILLSSFWLPVQFFLPLIISPSPSSYFLLSLHLFLFPPLYFLLRPPLFPLPPSIFSLVRHPPVLASSPPFSSLPFFPPLPSLPSFLPPSPQLLIPTWGLCLRGILELLVPARCKKGVERGASMERRHRHRQTRTRGEDLVKEICKNGKQGRCICFDGGETDQRTQTDTCRRSRFGKVSKMWWECFFVY